MKAPRTTRAAVRAASLCLAVLYGCGGEPTVEALPDTREAYTVGTATLNRVTSIGLRIGNGPVIGSPDALCLRDNSVIVIDCSVSKQLYEYSVAGAFIRTIGAWGSGDGEYQVLLPRAIATDAAGRLWLYDGGWGHLKVFGPDGTFSSNLGHAIGVTDALEFAGDRHLVQLAQEDGIAFLRRYDRLQNRADYSTRLTDESHRVLVTHFSVLAGLCADAKRRRVYYVRPGDYRVSDVDLDSGQVRRVFGMRPAGYRRLPDEYYGRRTLQPKEGAGVLASTTLLHGGMHLLSGRYLLLGFGRPGEEHASWLLYDTALPTRAYELDERARTALRGMRGLRSDGSLLYGLTEPADDELDELNGTVTGFVLATQSGSIPDGAARQDRASDRRRSGTVRRPRHVRSSEQERAGPVASYTKGDPP